MASGNSDSGNSNRGNGGGGVHGALGGGVAFPFAPASPIVVSGFGAADLDADATATAAANASLSGRDVFPPGKDLADHFFIGPGLSRFRKVLQSQS